MKLFLSLATAALLCAPTFAQKMGSINGNAPSLTQAIEAGGAKMSLNYTSIAWGQGKTFEMAMDKEKGARARTRINATAKESPLGTFSSSVDVMCGDLKLAAGEYKIAFTINEECQWEINFMGKETMTMKLPLMDNKDMAHKRLLMSLYAGDDAGAGVYVAFGTKVAMLSFAPATEKKG